MASERWGQKPPNGRDESRGRCQRLEDLARVHAGVLALADGGCRWLTEALIVGLLQSGGVCHGEEGVGQGDMGS